VFSSTDNIEDSDNPLMIKVELDPRPEDGDTDDIPAYIIAKDIFIRDVRKAVQRYVDAVGTEVEYDYEIPYLIQLEEESMSEEEGKFVEEAEEEDSPAFGENLKPRTFN
jgi:hypothetical protein